MRAPMSVRRGFLRLAISLAALWLVFWNFAYVMGRHSSLSPEPATFVLRISAWNVVVPCLVTTLLLGTWVAFGFRPDARP
jgi:hypothetical protein